MNGQDGLDGLDALDALDALLSVDPRDVGCDAAMEAMAAYAEVVLAGGDPEATHPGVTAHLAACGPCATDLAGLLAAIRSAGPDEDPGWSPGGGAPRAER